MANVNFSGRLYNFVGYGVSQTPNRSTTTKSRARHEHKPKLLLAGASAYPRIIDLPASGIADEVGAFLMVDMAHIVVWSLPASTQPSALLRHRHLHHSQDPARPRGGLVLCKENLAKKINSQVFPGIQGGPSCTSSRPRLSASRKR